MTPELDEAIFNQGGFGGGPDYPQVANDKKRHQTHLTPNSSDMRSTWSMLRRFIASKLGKHYIARTPVSIRSLAGCLAQHHHTDHDWKKLAAIPDHLVPLALLTAISDTSRLLVWPNSIKCNIPAASTPPVELILEPGDILIFRGDLLHAGAAYPDDNYRLHVFIDPGSESPYLREKDVTYIPELK